MKETGLRALVTMNHNSHNARSKRTTTAGWPDAAIAELAADQALNVSRVQLLALGVSASAVTRAVARGRLHRVHQGVYSLAPPRARPQRAAEHAAILACRPPAVLSHVTAAHLHGLQPPSGDRRIHVTVTTAHGHRQSGLVIHRSIVLHAAEHHRLDRLPVTSVARTVIDLAPGFGPAALEVLLDRGLKKTSRTKLREALARHPRRPGTPLLARLLDPSRPSADTWSARERRLREMLRRAGLPLPDANISLGLYTPDLVWVRYRVIVEYDSDEHHSGPAAVRWDTARHNEFSSRGYLVIHVTADELDNHPERVLAQIAAALAIRGA